MPLQTATNPKTGERVALVDGEWKPITQSATNDQGAKAYLVDNSWVTDTPAPKPEPKSRNIFAVLNDTVITLANSAANNIAAAANFVAPGNSFSEAVDKFAKEGESKQSDIVKAGREKFYRELEAADTIGGEALAVGKYALQNPLQAAAQAAGSVAGPGLAVKGATTAATLLKVAEKTLPRVGLTAGVVSGAIMSGGDAAGSAYKLVMETPDNILLQNDFVKSQIAAGRTLADIKEEAATTAARRASIIPALIGGIAGRYGIEPLLAGKKTFTKIINGVEVPESIFSRALITGVSEAAQEGVEEGATEYAGRKAAQEYNPTIDPTKGVAGAATLGAVLGGGPGAVIGGLSAAQEQAAFAKAQEEAAKITQVQPGGATPLTAAPSVTPPEVTPPVASPAEMPFRALTPEETTDIPPVTTPEVTPSVTPPVAEVTPPVAEVAPPVAEVTPPVAEVTPAAEPVADITTTQIYRTALAHVQQTGEARVSELQKVTGLKRKEALELIGVMESQGILVRPKKNAIAKLATTEVADVTEPRDLITPTDQPSAGVPVGGVEVPTAGIETPVATGVADITGAAGQPAVGEAIQPAPLTEPIITEEPSVTETAQAVETKEERQEATAPAVTTQIPYDTVEFVGQGIPLRRSSGEAQVINYGGRMIVMREVNGVMVPFYLSTGRAGKADVASGKWYPFFGIGTDGWINKTGGADMNNYYGSVELKEAAQELDRTVGDIRNDQSIPKVSSTGKHVDFINQGLTPTENNQKNTLVKVRENIARITEAVTTKPAVDETQQAINDMVEAGTQQGKTAEDIAADITAITGQTTTPETIKTTMASLPKRVVKPVEERVSKAKSEAKQVKQQELEDIVNTPAERARNLAEINRGLRASAKKEKTEAAAQAAVEENLPKYEVASAKLDKAVRKALEKNNIDVVLSVISDPYTNNSVTAAFARKIEKLLETLDIQPTIRLGKVEAGKAAKYDPSNESITVDLDNLKGERADVVVLHEVTHFAVDHAIDNQDKLNVAQKNALYKLKQLHEHAKATFGNKYDIATLKEFIAQAFSNPDFQTAMAKAKPMSSEKYLSNMFSEFAKRVLKLIGYSPNMALEEEKALHGGVYGANLADTITQIEELMKAPRVGKAKGVSYMAGETMAAPELPEKTLEQFIADQPLPKEPTGIIGTMRSWYKNGLAKSMKEAARQLQNEQQPVKDHERTITRQGLLIVGDDNKFNNLYTQIMLAKGNFTNIDNSFVKNPVDEVHALVHKFVKEQNIDLQTALQKLAAYGVVLHEGEVRAVKFLRKVPLRNDIESVEWFGKKISPATARDNIFKDLESKEFVKTAEGLGMTPDELARAYRKLLDAIVKVKTNLDPGTVETPLIEQHDINNTMYNVVGGLTPTDTKRYIDEFKKDAKTKAAMDEILDKLKDVSDVTIELNKDANYWSQPVTNLVSFYGYEHYVPYKGKPITEEDRKFFVGEHLGKEHQNAEYTQEGRLDLPENPILRMLADAHLSAARAARKDVMPALFHSANKSKLNPEGQGLIEADVIDIVPFSDRYIAAGEEKLMKYANRKDLFFYYMKDGDIALIQMKDDRMRDAIRKTYRQESPVIDKINNINSFFAQMHTRYSVGFAPMNFVVDMLTNSYNISMDYGPDVAARYIKAIGQLVLSNGLIKAGKVAYLFRQGGADLQKNSRLKALVDADKSGFTADLVEYLSVGGDVAYINSLTAGGQFKDLLQEGKPTRLVSKKNIDKFFDTWTGAFEFTSRTAAYRIAKAEEVGKLVAKGVPLAQAKLDARKPAAAFAKGLANFEETGLKGKTLGALFMFYRASATGAVRAIESAAPAISSVFGGTEVAAERAWKQVPSKLRAKGGEEAFKKSFIKQAKNGKATTMALIGMGAAMYMMSYATAGDDDMERNRLATDDMTRWSRNARFFVGGGPNDIINIPWGFGHGAFPAMGAQIASLGMSDTSFPEVMANLVPIMMDSFLPIPVSKGNIVENPANYLLDSIMPTIVRPILEFTMNYDNLGREIYNNRQGPVGNVYTGGDNIPEVWKSAARNLYEMSGFTVQMSPNTMYFFANAYADALAKMGQTSFNLYLDAVGEKDFNLKTDTLVLERFIGAKSNYDSRKWAAIEKDMEQRKNNLSELKDNPEQYFAYLESHPLDEMLVEMYNADVGGELKALRSEAKEIRRDPNLDVRTKTEMLNTVKLQQDLIKMQLVDLYKSFGVEP